LSVRAEILCGILKKIVLGLDGKKFFKNGQEVVLEFYAPKNGHQYPCLGCLKRPHLENRLSVRTEIFCGILKEIVLGLDGKDS
jgi:hypothetical protein